MVEPLTPAGTPDNDKILKKIADILALAENSPYEAERETAMRQYEALVTRHSIDLQTIRQYQTGKTQPEEPIMEHVEVGTEGDRGGGAYTNLLVAIARQNGVRCITYVNNRFVDLYGFPYDIKATKDLYAVLVGQMVAGAIDYLESGEYRKSRTEARKSFYVGFINRIEERLREAREEAENQARKDYAGQGVSTDLVLRDKKKAVDKLFYEDYYAIRTYRSRSQPRATDAAARRAGDNAGSRARIFKSEGVSGKAGAITKG